LNSPGLPLPGGVSDDVVVVSAAIVADGRLLAAQRREPPRLAGGWELPGGKVEPGETDELALIRECREELGVDIQLGDRVGGDWPLPPSAVLRVWLATVVNGVPEPLEDHLALRWLRADELKDVAWLPADLPVVAELRRILERREAAGG
jgi:8-oxo-dGTP diphosphatase